MALKFPADFDKCVRAGGRTRTINIKGQPNKYMHVCYDKAGKSHPGEVHTKKKASEVDFYLTNLGYEKIDGEFVMASETKLRKLIPQIKLSEKTFKQKTTEIEVLHSGEWEHPQYGMIKITDKDIDKFVQSFDDNVRKVDIAIDQEHMPEKGAAGWYKSLKKVFEDGKTKLKATIEWTKLGQQLIKDGIFKYFSPEFDFEYEDQETHENFANVLIGGGLTNRPYFKSLAPVALSESMYAGFQMADYRCECLKCGYTLSTDKHCKDIKCPKCSGEMRRIERPGVGNAKGGEKKMTKNELKAKLAESPDFVLAEGASKKEVKLFDEVKDEIAKEAENKEEKEKKEKEEEEAKAKEEEKKKKKEEEGVKGSENFISKADHTKQMNELKSEMGIVQKQLRTKEVQAAVEGYMFSESNQKGVLLTKNKDAATQILMSATPKVAKLFKEFLDKLVPVSSKLFEEQGGAEDGGDKKDIIAKEAQEMVDKKKAKSYGEAIKTLHSEKPELFKEE